MEKKLPAKLSLPPQSKLDSTELKKYFLHMFCAFSMITLLIFPVSYKEKTLHWIVGDCALRRYIIYIFFY